MTPKLGFPGLMPNPARGPASLQLSTEVIRLSDEQQRIKCDIEAKEKSLQQRLSEDQHRQLLELQQQADGRLQELKHLIANKQPILQQATSALDMVRVWTLGH